jgi:hypothetical protein
MDDIPFVVDYDDIETCQVIRWMDDENSIEDCHPYIMAIRCDDGEDYKFLEFSKREIVDASLQRFSAIEENYIDTYYLTYSAHFTITDYHKRSEFVAALGQSDNFVEIVIGWKNAEGEPLTGCYEGELDQPALMEEV